MNERNAKQSAALKALEWVKTGMIVGLGSGTTTHLFIELLNERYKKGLHIQAIASSVETLNVTRQSAIPLINPNELAEVDLTIDGADEIDPQKRMVKGAGGALVREKILANMSREVVIIVDSSKCVEKLGKRPLPVEIIPFGAEVTRLNLEQLGYQGIWRENQGNRYITDNGNYILDIYFDTLRDTPEMDHALISEIPGVVDTGFFFELADHCIIGYSDGEVKIWN